MYDYPSIDNGPAETHVQQIYFLVYELFERHLFCLCTDHAAVTSRMQTSELV